MIDCDNIISNVLARVGDRVFYNVKASSERYRENGHMNGKLGVVFAFHLYKDYVPNWGRGLLKPGVYQRRGATIVRWDDGTGGVVSEHDLSWWPWADESPAGVGILEAARLIKAHNQEMIKRRQAERDVENEYTLGAVRLGDLPQLDVYEQDTVQDASGKAWLVRMINWNYYGERRSDGSFMPLLEVTRTDGTGGSQALDLGEARVIGRGNVWKWYHGEASCLSFDDALEEARFYRGLGRSTQIKSPSGGYGFTMAEAVEAIRKGEADAIGFSGHVLGRSGTVDVWKYHDEAPAARIRAATMASFGVNAGLHKIPA